MGDKNIAYEEYIPTDRFSIQDMYLLRIQRFSEIFVTVMEARLRGGEDQRALVRFWARTLEFRYFGTLNIQRHLTKTELTELDTLIKAGMRNDRAERIYELLTEFFARSKLTELSEKKFLGPFAYGRKELGIQRGEYHDAD